MIYLNAGDQHIVILEPGNIDAIKAGKMAKSPGKAVLVTYTPDGPWLSDQITANFDNLTPATLDRLLEESQARPEVRDQPQVTEITFSSESFNITFINLPLRKP